MTDGHTRAERIAYAGFSLVELLVSIAMISALVGLTLPAIQSARESARRVECQNHLRQIGLVLLLYHDEHGTFPHGGWGHQWVGVPDCGFGEGQPGGWIYSVLPYCDHGALHDLGIGQTGIDADRDYSDRLQTPIDLFACPTRRPPSLWPVANQYAYVRTPKPHGDVSEVARADYAINGGVDHIFSFSGPASIGQGGQSAYWTSRPSAHKFNGISHLRIGASLRTIDDGASKTYLVGEKYVPVNDYQTGASLGDNESLYAGYCSDLHRFAGMTERETLGKTPYAAPLSDNSQSEPDGVEGFLRFGSAHAGGFTMVSCDGSAQFLSFDIDPRVHYLAGHRRDNGRTAASH